jgi:predicted unusual protein kinase regulating ubiquinone biosynthesis (AarF/ABC1/UbiB family)
VPTGRLKRLGKLGRMAAGLAGDLAGAAGRMVVKSRDEAAAQLHAGAARRLFETMAQMKGLPMKLGQTLSYLDDFVPPEHRDVWRETLAALQVKARPLSSRAMAAVIEADLGAPPEELFARFSKKPIAAASIGQVYRATLRDGREVAVKVQYPGVAQSIRDDLKNVKMLKSALGVVLPKVQVEQSLADISARVLEECDYGHELENQRDFAARWAGDAEVVVPAVVPECSSEHVLTTELVEAPGFHRFLEDASAEERARAGRTIYRFVFRSLYLFGMFNADPHPGNYLFLPDGRVAFLDFGCVQRFSPEALADFVAVRKAFVDGLRGDALWEIMAPAYGLPRDLDAAERAFLERYLGCCFEPVLEDRVFRYERAYTEKLAGVLMDGKMLFLKKALLKGIREAGRPGLVFLNRIQFGLASVLAMLGTEGNFHRMIRDLDEEAAQ